MDRVADADHRTQRDAERMTGGDRLFGNGSGLRNQRHTAAARHIAQKRRGEAARSLEQIDVARAVRTADGQTVRLGQRTQLAVPRFAVLTALGKASRQDQQIAMTARDRFSHHIEYRVRTHDHDHEIAGRGDLAE